jgi:schlafen family protein
LTVLQEVPISVLLLPDSGQVTIGELAHAIASAPEVLQVPDLVVLRLVAYQGGNTWWPFAACLRVGISNEANRVESASPLKLIQVVTPATRLGRIDDLRTFLNSTWVHQAGLRREGGAVQDHISIYRHSSRSLWHRYPSWTGSISLADQRGPRGNLISPPPAPNQPFFNSETRFFADNVADVAKQWLELPNADTSLKPSGRIELVIPDPRGYFSEVIRQGGLVSLTVAGSESPSGKYVAVKSRTPQGAEGRSTFPVIGNGIQYESSEQMFSVEAFLLDQDGFCYDRFAESEQRRGPFADELLGRREQDEPIYRELLDALLHGEDDLTEFKEWVPLDGADKKSAELLKTLCAFANARGGSLYVGVSEEAEVLGTRRRLRAEQEEAFLKRIYQIAREGLAPSVIVKGCWIDHAEHRILRLDVEEAVTKPCEVMGIRQVYIRRGASSRKATVAEIRLMIDGKL